MLPHQKPASLHDAINMARKLVEQAIQAKVTRISEGNKRKWEDHQRIASNNNNPNNNNNNRNRNNNNQHQQQNRRHDAVKAYVAAPADGRGYAGNLPKCNHCNSHHNGQCPPKYQKCQISRHQEKDCRARALGTGVNSLQDVTCYGCGEKGHFKNKCPKKSFLSIGFTLFIDIAPVALDTSYEVELVDGKVFSTNTVLRDCTLALFNYVFKIDLLPTRLDSFDVIVGMDWLSYNRVVIVCYEKIVCIPLPNGEILEIQGERPKKDLRLLSCIKADEKKPEDIRFTGYYRRFIEKFSKIAKPFTLLTQKNKTYVWGDKQEEASRILKKKLCNAPMLALPDRPNDCVVYCDASNQGFGCVLMQRGKVIADYECEIEYHPGKANVVADALSRKERLKPRRVCVMSMTTHFGPKTKILEAQKEHAKDLKALVESL
nr:hypothetical protein [Tanacetum cinerariifolium]